MKKETIDFTTLYGLCNRNNWFTGGTNEQYEKLFQRNREGASIEELSIIIWVCSEACWEKDKIKDILISELQDA